MDDIWKSAEKAIEFDRAGKLDAAIYFYGDAAHGILDALSANKISAISIDQRPRNMYLALNSLRNCLLVERAEFLLYQALNEDEDGNIDEAVQLYSEAIQLCLSSKEQTSSTELQQKLKALATKALGRAEVLKLRQSQQQTLDSLPLPPIGELALGDDGGASGDDSGVASSSSGSGANSLPLPPSDPPQSASTPNTKRRLMVAGKDAFTADELAVLRATSVINGREFVPFMSVDLKERFAYPVPFSDKDGIPALSEKQRSKLTKWSRPEEFLDAPAIIERIDSGTIKQTIVSDCSFIASLAIAARYERKTGKKLVTNCIYPQNRNGDPVYNPCGKYMVVFHLNGVRRKVLIDDRLPIGQYGDLLCSYSQNRNELWISLLEKAYMKVMGGYDFPGSNSNIDLHALTGWIPERIAIRPGSADFNAAKVFDMLLERYHKGDCLVTLATGKLSQQDQDRAGLVECHAYAMLDVRNVLGQKLLLVKNPWTHLRWKGRYSERDTSSWTPELQKALGYNPQDAQQFDDGVFWIDYDSLCHFFDVFYVNWNPSLFSNTYCIHGSWNAGTGPVKDLYTIADNPQFSLEVRNNGKPTAVWVLLTRHITDKVDFAENREYITVLIYDGGKKKHYPFDPPPMVEGVRINSPHYLCKLVAKSDSNVQRYTLVVAQYEKSNTIYYTLRVYSTADFRLSKIISDYNHVKRETGEWKGRTAGGCANYRDTHGNNPVYQLKLETTSDSNQVFIELKGPKQYSVGFEVVQVLATNNKMFPKQESGTYRPGYCVLTLENVPSGVYNIMPSTFLQNQEGPFFLTLKSTANFKLARM